MWRDAIAIVRAERGGVFDVGMHTGFWYESPTQIQSSRAFNAALDTDSYRNQNQQGFINANFNGVSFLDALGHEEDGVDTPYYAQLEAFQPSSLFRLGLEAFPKTLDPITLQYTLRLDKLLKYPAWQEGKECVNDTEPGGFWDNGFDTLVAPPAPSQECVCIFIFQTGLSDDLTVERAQSLYQRGFVLGASPHTNISMTFTDIVLEAMA